MSKMCDIAKERTTLEVTGPVPSADVAVAGSIETGPHFYPPSGASAHSHPSRISRTFELPPQDGGSEAWKFLAAAFTIECVVWSLPTAYGVFLDYYINHTSLGKSTSSSLLSLAGTCQSGIMYCSAPLIFYSIGRHPHTRQILMWCGVICYTAALTGAAFAKQPWQVLMTHGVLYAIGGALLYFPAFSYLVEWFVKRRGMANGILIAGTSVGGVFMPYLTQQLLSNFGIRSTLLALGISGCIILAIALPFIKHRVPPSHVTNNQPPRIPILRIFLSASLWLYAFANAAQALGYFLTTLYLPSFASEIRLSSIKGTTALALLNATATISRLSFGLMTDYFSAYLVGSVSLFLTAFCVFVLWGFTATTFAPLLVFATVFGLVGGGFSALYSGVLRDLAGNDAKLNGNLYGIISLTRGIGNILAAPISNALLTSNIETTKKPSTVYDTSFASVVLVSGSALLASALLNGGVGVVRSKKVE